MVVINNKSMEIKFDPLGDGISLVELVDYMGSDESIVRAARVSYNRDDSTMDIEKDAKLIKYMITHGHGTPFEHNSITLNVTLPIFVARQWIRHRIGVSYNEISRRYTHEDIQFYIPAQWRSQDSKNKQGSNQINDLDFNGVWSDNLEIHCRASLRLYQDAIDYGIGNEMARLFLPVNLYTRWYFTANFRSILHWYTLRADSHAQWEIQQYARCIGEIMGKLFPMAWPIAVEWMEQQKAKS